MNNFNDTFIKCCKKLSPCFDDKCFNTDIFLNNKQGNSTYKYYTVNFYICMLFAGVDESIYLQAPENRKLIYKCAEDYNLLDKDRFDLLAAIYCGEYDLADHIIDISDDDYICSRLVKEECWDYIDRITDCGKNKNHTDIMTCLLINYLKGGDSIFKYIARYNKNDPMTNDMALNVALGEINSADEIFDSILDAAFKIDLDECSDVNEKKFNKRSIDLMKRCAKLGMTLKTFDSFKEILIPVYSEENVFCFDDTHRIYNEYIRLPGILARLIDKNTVVYCRKIKLPDYNDDLSDGTLINYFRTVEFKNNTNNFPAYVDELEYICIDFKKRYGKKLVIYARNVNELCGMKYIPKELFEINMSCEILEGFYNEINDLKKVLDYGVLSQKNIDEITAYFVSKVNSSRGSDNAFAIKRLRQLGDKLTKMKGKEK